MCFHVNCCCLYYLVIKLHHHLINLVCFDHKEVCYAHYWATIHVNVFNFKCLEMLYLYLIMTNVFCILDKSIYEVYYLAFDGYTNRLLFYGFRQGH